MTEQPPAPATGDDPIDPPRWGTILGLLSLDLIEPWVARLSLQLPPGDEFRDGLRKMIIRYREAERDANGAPALPFARATLQWAAATFGMPFARHLFQWGTEVFGYAGDDNANAFLWRAIALRACAPQSDEPPPALVVLCRRLRATPAAFPPRHPAKTPWDIAFHQRHGYGESLDPMEWVVGTAAHVRFVAAWATWVSEMRVEPELAAIEAWGRREAGRLGMPLDILGAPGAWRPLPPPWRP